MADWPLLRADCGHGSTQAPTASETELPRRCVSLLGVCHLPCVNSNQVPGMPSPPIRKWHHPCPVNTAVAFIPAVIPPQISLGHTGTCGVGDFCVCALSQRTGPVSRCPNLDHQSPPDAALFCQPSSAAASVVAGVTQKPVTSPKQSATAIWLPSCMLPTFSPWWSRPVHGNTQGP